MDEVILRFPHLAEKIFDELNDKSLFKCAKVSDFWQSFIEEQKSTWIRKIQKYQGDLTEFSEDWNKVLDKIPLRVLKELTKAVHGYLATNSLRLMVWLQMTGNQWSPSHIAAYNGCVELYQYVSEKSGYKNHPSKENGLTPLHTAARKGHLEICKYIISNVRIKNPADNFGFTPLHDAAIKGHSEVCMQTPYGKYK